MTYSTKLGFFTVTILSHALMYSFFNNVSDQSTCDFHGLVKAVNERLAWANRKDGTQTRHNVKAEHRCNTFFIDAYSGSVCINYLEQLADNW